MNTDRNFFSPPVFFSIQEFQSFIQSHQLLIICRYSWTAGIIMFDRSTSGPHHKACIPCSRWVILLNTQREKRCTNNMKCTWLTQNRTLEYPMRTIIHWLALGLTLGCQQLGSSTVGIGSERLFRYQHVGIGNAQCSRWGLTHREAPPRVVSWCSGI